MVFPTAEEVRQCLWGFEIEVLREEECRMALAAGGTKQAHLITVIARRTSRSVEDTGLV